MAVQFHLPSYLERIGYSGHASPTLDTLRALQKLHPRAIPFENLDPLLRVPVDLDMKALQQKMVRDGRGGWCFEQNLLFKHALEAIGFKVTGLAARVFLNRPPDAVPPRTHMMLRVDLDGSSYVVDAGFGGMTLTGPVRLETNTVQPTPHERRRLTAQDDELVMQAEIRGEWKTLYRFNLVEHLLPDYQIYNWYLCNHPDSHFLKALIAARPTPSARYALRNNELAVYYLNGGTERTTFTTAGELRDALQDVFRIELPLNPDLNALLERMVQHTPD